MEDTAWGEMPSGRAIPREMAARTPRRPPGSDAEEETPFATCPIASAISDGWEKEKAEVIPRARKRKGERGRGEGEREVRDLELDCEYAKVCSFPYFVFFFG